MANIALFFGSFNPIHLGHISLAKETLRLNYIDEVWFIVSPQSPFKKDLNLIDAIDRVEMVKLAIGSNSRLKVSDIEIRENPKCFTVDTLRLLEKQNPGNIFHILMGQDNLSGLDQWKESDYIKNNYKILVYPRKDQILTDVELKANIEYFKADYINISSTAVRNGIKNGQNLTSMLPIGVYDYIVNKNLLKI